MGEMNSVHVARIHSRMDWSMRQFVDGIKARLAAGDKPHDLRAAMYMRGVPHHVQFRILSGG